MALLRLVRPIHPVKIETAATEVVDVDVPDIACSILVGVELDFDPGPSIARLVEQTKIHRGSVTAEQRELNP
jgi:hypothetical protein